VTNFVSARDTNHTLSIDKYFDIFGEEMKGGPEGNNQDALWNFHSWTETWMARPDLPHGFGGWQAVDATPMEASRRGPSSIEAVRRGEVGFAFETNYVIRLLHILKIYINSKYNSFTALCGSEC